MLMRVHGIKTIRRRTDIKVQTNYRNYIADLREDFYYICGYCGKHEMVSHKGMEPDHFVPLKVDLSRKYDYSNLVYSCFTCNHKKLGKWPTEDKDKPFDDEVGIVDPASLEYDKHLSRTNEGAITYNTELGKYIVEKVFKFNIRPTREIWQATKLHELTDKLDKLISERPQEELKRFIELVTELRQLNKYLFDCNE